MRSFSSLAFASAGLALFGCSNTSADRARPNIAYAEAGVDTSWISDAGAGFSFITDISPSPAGGVFVLDRKELTVTELSSLGKLVRTFGSRGDGPGEIARPFTLGLYNDSLWVTDLRARRLTLFSLRRQGDVRVMAPYIAVGMEKSLQPMAIMADGSVIMASPGREGALGDAMLDTVFRIDRGTLTAIGATTRVVIWQFPGEYGFLKRPLQPFIFWDGFTIARDGSASLTVETSKARLIEEGKFVVTRKDFVNQSAWRVEVPYSPKRLEKRSIDSVVRAATDGFPEQFQAARDSLFKPRTTPPVRGIVAGRFGAVWIGRNDLEGNRWQSVSPDSSTRRMVAFPTNFQPYVFSRDSVWGVLRDTNDVVSVALLTIRSRQSRTPDI